MVRKKMGLSAHSMAWLEMELFFTQSEITTVCHVYVTQSSLKRLFHVTHDMTVSVRRRLRTADQG